MVNEASLFYAKLATVAIAFAGKALFRHQAYANIKLASLKSTRYFWPPWFLVELAILGIVEFMYSFWI